jgi:hypothetical protein
MEKIPKESLEQIMKEIEAATEKKTLELMGSEDGKKLKNITKKSKNVDERFAFLANPKKTVKELSIDEQIDAQVEKILKEKDKKQKQMKKIVGNFTKI